MKIYKERQFLIFDFEDGKTVKYDFATKTTIGKKGNPVNNLKTQLSGLTLNQLCDLCLDKQYGKFLSFVVLNEERSISNVGTILSKVPHYSNYEQLFSAGIERFNGNFRYDISQIPNGLIKLCRKNNLIMEDNLVEFYKENPDVFNLAFNLKYISLTKDDIRNMLISYESSWYRGHYHKTTRISKLINDYGYTAKAIFLYIDYCKTFEALEDMGFILKELLDYAEMMNQISNKFDKYPKHFLTTHKIASRNYNRLKKEFEESAFQKRIDKSMEKTFGRYCFIYPNTTQDIKDESVQMNNCVSSYIQKVIDGECHILFLRNKDNPERSLVTIEVINGKIVQALQRFNHPLTKEQKEVVDKWNKWYAKKCESEEVKND